MSPWGVGRMCRGHRQQRPGEGVRVSPGLPVPVSAAVCVWRMGSPTYACQGVVALCDTVCACFSDQLFP